uniref:Uncharacterized protein LOC111133576 isoform X2 n=1 Tax=Crassostrea virginica TaxID=6565 RepID=A0A8B8ECD4_CRAVI|nr:uncharacterized protein LOC111133576 isoform X2 [Crassostrea virginica]
MLATACLVISVCFVFTEAQVQPNKVSLEKISTLYIPSKYNSHDYPEFKLGKQAAEQLAYDPAQRILYVTGEERLNVVDLSKPTDPIMLYRKEFNKMDPTDVEYCGNHVFVSLDNDEKPEEGKVLVFRKYNRRHNTMPIVLDVTVGPSPNMLLPTTNCQKVLVALEGEPFARGGDLIDPEGAIGILKFPYNYISDTTYSYKILDFRNFNDKFPILARSGVRHVYKGNGNTLAQDLEPEHITYSADEKKAYVSLQENNAIAEIDMVTETISEIRGLGFKDWKQYKLDPSDNDGGINIYPYPIYGIYQPDSIRTVTVGGREYIVTADEGDSKDYSGLKLTNPGFNENKRVNQITLANNSEVLQWARKRKIPNIQHDALLGRLYISSEDGRLRDGTYDKLYTFGGRGFSVLRSDTMERIYDSGSSFEDSHALRYPKLFNSYAKSSANITDTFDTRSDSKGPETESIAIAYDAARVIVFLGSERPGSISIYSFNNDMTGGTLESVYSGANTILGTWGDAFAAGMLTNMDPDDIKYLAPFQSPTGQPLLVVAGSDTGTVSLFHVLGLNDRLQQNPFKAHPLKNQTQQTPKTTLQMLSKETVLSTPSVTTKSTTAIPISTTRTTGAATGATTSRRPIFVGRPRDLPKETKRTKQSKRRKQKQEKKQKQDQGLNQAKEQINQTKGQNQAKEQIKKIKDQNQAKEQKNQKKDQRGTRDRVNRARARQLKQNQRRSRTRSKKV